jgi:hypothetical protein
MNRIERSAGLALCMVAATLVTACGVVPYQPTPQDVLVPVKLVGMGSPRMCRDGKFYSLTTDAAGDTVRVPAGQRITFGTYMYFDGYNVSYSCLPQLSFVPEAGRSYVSNSGLRDQRCFVELVREDVSRDTGVAPELSLGAPYCAPAKK